MEPHAATALTGTRRMMQGDPGTCAVRLVDRRTGDLHRVNGTPLTVYTRHPAEAVAELLEGRDPSLWEARIEPIDPGVRR